MRILDYGCGKGTLARRLAARGHDVVAYDPDPALGFGLTSPDAVTGTFDMVICELVLCVIEDDAEYRRVLADLKRFVRPDGRVVVAVCHPDFTFAGDTPLQRRVLPPGARPDIVFVWEKVHAQTGARRRDVHRPRDLLRRDLLHAGLAVESMRETRTVDLERFEPASDHLVLRLRPVAVDPAPVTLLIKTNAMEWRTIEAQVKHLVTQLEEPARFQERLIVIDTRTEGFVRPYDTPDAGALEAAVERLVGRGWINRVVRGPSAPAELIRRWFGVDTSATHAANGSPVATTLAAFEACATDYVLQVDSDLLVYRRDRRHDYLGEMLKLLEGNPRALTASLNIIRDSDQPWTAGDHRGPWRFEVRGSLVHLPRLKAASPLPNETVDGQLRHAWYRSADLAIRRDGLLSLRGGPTATGFRHPPNTFKRDQDAWMAVMDRVERGFIPEAQVGRVEFDVSLKDWLGPKRAEPFIFVVTGRNVPPGRFRRCLDSIFHQRNRSWGAVVVDDASDRPLVARDDTRITSLRPKFRRGQLANLVWAIRHVCTNRESVILTLDADDALLGDGVIDRVAREYARGADVTVGSMLRTDKPVEYPVDFSDPRHTRGGGNVWQHLRTFKKRMFDSIPDDHLRLDGKYVDIARDWAYMVPIVEMAAKPIHIPERLYLYEPSGDSPHPHREEVIARLMAKSSLARPSEVGGRTA